MFHASHAVLFFDYFRIPYRVTGAVASAVQDGERWGRIMVPRPDGTTSRTLWWPRLDARSAGPGSLPFGRYHLGEIPIFAPVATNQLTRERTGSGEGWRAVEAVTDQEGRAVSRVWRDVEGNVVLPFDPSEVIMSYWTERYLRSRGSALASGIWAGALRGYYLIRSLLPRSVQLRLRRAFTRFQEAPDFPRWPTEPALADFYDWAFATVARLAERPVPWIAPWPEGRSWAMVLTHDVEARAGYEHIDLLRQIERDLDYRSSWNFVPLRGEPELRYEVQESRLRSLVGEGCEIGVHGLRHDGRDLNSARSLRARLPIIRSYALRWGAVGFRAPATQRAWEWLPRLGFDYDSSYPDTDPYEPQPGGCLSQLPLLNGPTVELPITLPQDHTMFAILQHADAAIWLEKARYLRERGGMALVLTHPDYADDARLLDGYRMLLRTFADDPSVWRALPREVSSWWRRRAASSVEQEGGSWVIRGPASDEGRILLADPDIPVAASVGGAP